jgi:hypothetical protein
MAAEILSGQMIQERAKQKCWYHLGLALEVTHDHSYHILFLKGESLAIMHSSHSRGKHYLRFFEGEINK